MTTTLTTTGPLFESAGGGKGISLSKFPRLKRPVSKPVFHVEKRRLTTSLTTRGGR